MKAILGLAALLSFGCSETNSGPDAAKEVDSGFADSGSSPDSASSEDSGTDAGQVERDAAVIDGSLTGTSLEGVTVAWDAPVVLCETSHFGGSAEELADAALEKVQVSLRPHPRTSLEPSALATATLDQGRIDRGPFSAESVPRRRRRIDAGRLGAHRPSRIGDALRGDRARPRRRRHAVRGDLGPSQPPATNDRCATMATRPKPASPISRPIPSASR